MVETYRWNDAKWLKESIFFEFWIEISHYNILWYKVFRVILTSIFISYLKNKNNKRTDKVWPLLMRKLTEVTKGSQKLRLVISDTLTVILVPCGQISRSLNLFFLHFRLFWHIWNIGTPNQKKIFKFEICAVEDPFKLTVCCSVKAFVLHSWLCADLTYLRRKSESILPFLFYLYDVRYFTKLLLDCIGQL